MKKFTIKKRNSNTALTLSFVVMIAFAIFFACAVLRLSITQTVGIRAQTDLNTISSMQKTIMLDRIDEQYQPLYTIEKLLQNGEVFADDQMKPYLKAEMDAYGLCMLGYADIKGNVTDYNGELMGDISDRTYFTDIVSGSKDRCCEYLATTKSINEPRVMFSVPVHNGQGKITGVLFSSMEVEVIEGTLFEDSDINLSSSMVFVCDESGSLIVANDAARSICDGVACNGVCDGDCNVYECVPDIAAVLNGHQENQSIEINGEWLYASVVSLGLNDWHLVCIVDEKSASAVYEDTSRNIEQMIVILCIAFLVVLAYGITITFMFTRRDRNEILTLRDYYDNYKQLFKEMRCVVVEYDPSTRDMAFAINTEEPYGIREWKGSMKAYEEYKTKHPEFDFAKLKKSVDVACRDCKTYSFESALVTQEEETRSVKIIAVPIIDENKTTRVFVVVLDITDMNKEQLEQARIQNSNSQMNPHFLYNALASIREVVLDNPQYAADLLYDFTVHLRACIKSMTNENLILFENELKNIKAYINIEKLRFGSRLDVRFECSELEFDIIPLGIQPLVENSIRHGVYEREDGGTVIVRSYKTDVAYVVEVEDDGIGFDFEETMRKVKSGECDSTGLANLIFRFEKVQKANVEIKSKIGVGTKVTVTIPIVFGKGQQK